MKNQTCFKSNNTKCIDFIFTNSKGNLKNTTAAETGLSDFHTMIATALKGGLIKRGAKAKVYRDYRSYKPDSLHYKIINNALPNLPYKVDYDSFEEAISGILEEHISTKKHVRPCK